MLTICNCNSLMRNAIRCGITAKVRRKNEFFPNLWVFYTKGAGLAFKMHGLKQKASPILYPKSVIRLWV